VPMTRIALQADARAYVARAESLSGWSPPAAPSLPAHIAAWIADRIQFGDFKPGEPIRELAVADHFDVSRGPVRDALRLLDRDGLVVLNGRKGAQVRVLTPEATEAIFRLRAEIFARMCRDATITVGTGILPEAVEGIPAGSELLVRLADHPEAPIGDYIIVRRGIWLLLSRLSGNDYLAQVSSALEREIAVLWASVQDPERRRRSAKLWVALCDAVAGGRVEDAERLGRDLVLAGLAAVQGAGR
jgi:DNA-binding GntR family transcriptional regulator